MTAMLSSYRSVCFFLLSFQLITQCSCLSTRSNGLGRVTSKNPITSDSATNAPSTGNGNNQSPINPRTHAFSIPLVNSRPKPSNIVETFIELWNDPRPVSSLMTNSDRSNVGSITREDNDDENEITTRSAETTIPYCIISDEFEIESEKFQILLYPRGRFVSSSTSTSSSSQEEEITGPASAYLRYLPKAYGDEIDIGWKLQLVDTRTGKAFPVGTSGGLPKSNDTWSAAMTFCTESEGVESAGRATDWGSSTWYAKDICDALGYLKAEGSMTVYGECRTGESSFGWPIASKGGIGAVRKAASESSSDGPRNFRVGEVIVPVDVKDDPILKEKLSLSFIYPGVDYRIMTMADKDDNPIFSTSSLPSNERQQAKLALRPCGWKLQQQLWRKDGMVQDWPVEVEASLLSSNALTRFNPESSVPRITTAFKRDWVAYTLALLLAVTPIPLTLIARNAVSLYAIPSASMEPTLLKGDVLLVEKLPGIYGRTKKGDVILFEPPQTLRDIISSSGGSKISSTSLFVKRVVGLPGDKDIIMDESTKDVMVNNEPSAGPDRNLCDDEPLRLIDRLLVNGKGKSITELGENDVYVLGDCKAVSVDSRVFGVLPKENIIGKPVSRIWPPSRMSSGPF
jgi:signal peptidase I